MMFKDKVVAITGAAGGIGQSLCRYFAGEGALIQFFEIFRWFAEYGCE